MFDFLKKNKGDILENMFTQEKVSATKAYMVAKYGMTTTKEQLLKEFFESARNMIQIKSQRHQFSVILELDDDLKEYLKQIVEHYRNYGYNVIVIDENTNISNSYNDKSTRITMMTLIVLTWDAPVEVKQLCIDAEQK